MKFNFEAVETILNNGSFVYSIMRVEKNEVFEKAYFVTTLN
jgi:hypothetical protein